MSPIAVLSLAFALILLGILVGDGYNTTKCHAIREEEA